MTNVRDGTILYGMMGCGKSTLGEGLAAHLDQPFVDTDVLIEEKFGQTCRALVAAGNFPKQQAQAIVAYSPTFPEVVATGGSVATYPELVRHLARFGVGIFIDVDPDVLEARLPAERIAALNNPQKLSFGGLYRARAEFYAAAADYRLKVPGEEPVGVTLGRIIDLRLFIAAKE